MDIGESYRGARDRILATAAQADHGTPVPATPGWNTLDLVRHVVGVSADVVTGDLDEYAQPQWTERQVQSRRGRSLDELADEWNGITEPMVAILADPVAHDRDALFGRAPMVDLVVHEGDLARAIGTTAEHDVALLDHLLTARLAMMGTLITAAGLDPLEVVTEDGQQTLVGEGDPAATLATDRRTLWRSLHGRRTREQVCAIGWIGDPEPYLDALLPWIFSFPDTEVEAQ